MPEVVKFFASDLSSLLFPKEHQDNVSGYPQTPPETTLDAWQTDRTNLSRDGEAALDKVLHEQEAKICC